MKKSIVTSSVTAIAVLISFWYVSCTKTCTGNGTLELTNTSQSTVQRIMIDGVNYGTVDPGEKKDIPLAAGTHSFQQQGISGGNGCSEASVIIVECKTTGFSCNG